MLKSNRRETRGTRINIIEFKLKIGSKMLFLKKFEEMKEKMKLITREQKYFE